ncbi:hypothetical protein GBAR_LOCUS2097 [Geodia barretti]|uniref:Uncharacterized protein n=1 Tax=Geodia barretti TaxID=519541 RepID=A0AA35W477_GEOBA|nr:hypothetical protein GBAR_LOCUS2097 [Geodia barretti]
MPTLSYCLIDTRPMNMCVCVFQSIRVSRMVFLGAVDYGALRTECMKRDQNSLSRRLKRLSLTRNSSNGRKTDLRQAYSFVKMQGPKMKGFAEMAVARVSHHELVPPQPAQAPPTLQPSYTKPTISPRLVVATKNGGSPSGAKRHPYHHSPGRLHFNVALPHFGPHPWTLVSLTDDFPRAFVLFPRGRC